MERWGGREEEREGGWASCLAAVMRDPLSDGRFLQQEARHAALLPHR